MTNEYLGGHNAILSVVSALKHGRSILDIILACSFTELSETHQNEWSKALIDLSDEICILKEIELVTAISDCNVSEPRSVKDSLKLFLTVVESTSTTVGEVFTLLHPGTLTDASSFDSIKSLPTCCDGERSLLVRYLGYFLL